MNSFLLHETVSQMAFLGLTFPIFPDSSSNFWLLSSKAHLQITNRQAVRVVNIRCEQVRFCGTSEKAEVLHPGGKLGKA